MYHFDDTKALSGLRPWEVQEALVPKFLGAGFYRLMPRIWSLLDGYSDASLEMVYDSLDWMIFQERTERTEQQSKSEGHAPPEFNGTTALLRHAMEQYELDASLGFGWPEYFALLALDEIAHAHWVENMFGHGGFTSSLQPEEYEEEMALSLVDATEAICLAENLKHSEQVITAEVHTKISLRNQQAAIQRHAKTRDLKKHLIDFYRSGVFPSKREAARRFYDGLADDDKLLTPTNAIRTLTGWLSKVNPSS